MGSIQLSVGLDEEAVKLDDFKSIYMAIYLYLLNYLSLG